MRRDAARLDVAVAEVAAARTVDQLREYAIPRSIADLIRDSPTARRVIAEAAALRSEARSDAR